MLLLGDGPKTWHGLAASIRDANSSKRCCSFFVLTLRLLTFTLLVILINFWLQQNKITIKNYYHRSQQQQIQSTLISKSKQASSKSDHALSSPDIPGEMAGKETIIRFMKQQAESLQFSVTSACTFSEDESEDTKDQDEEKNQECLF